MDLRISHSVCTKVQEKGILQRKKTTSRGILRTLCEWKKIKIVEAEVYPDHVHMLVEIPWKVSVSSFKGYLEGKSSLMIYEKYPELRYKYRNRKAYLDFRKNKYNHVSINLEENVPRKNKYDVLADGFVKNQQDVCVIKEILGLELTKLI